ncbi:hypothetical protein FTUN_6076 [Frigoriglobus tundricola]|uniref:Uncharacterized protein n=1 Tax=Frigoriglobus tundricola TaxID=2774151 RepID=A0A6M5YYG6_9BACT|nr:hypothetical protein FTUN_6076 [Frigoriglobus tundricola]
MGTDRQGPSPKECHMNHTDPDDAIQIDLDRFADDGNPHTPDE